MPEVWTEDHRPRPTIRTTDLLTQDRTNRPQAIINGGTMTNEPDTMTVWDWWCNEKQDAYIEDVRDFAATFMEMHARGQYIGNADLSRAVSLLMDAYEKQKYDAIAANYKAEQRWIARHEVKS